jgi:YjbE family integral membrane protein
MDGAAAAASLGVVLQILFLDLLLSGDNALVIALACRRLPERQARRAAWLGAAGAIGLRLILTTMAGALMELPFLQLLSALPLLVIAMNLMNGQDEEEVSLRGGEEAEDSVIAAVGIIILSDAAMSLDNVVALAAVSGGNFWLLMFGLAVSIPLIVFGSFGFSRLMRDYPWLADAGAAMLGWVAGSMIVGDPLLSGWVTTQAPALAFAAPLACAIFVLAQGRFGREEALRAAGDRPKRRVRPPAPRPHP